MNYRSGITGYISHAVLGGVQTAIRMYQITLSPDHGPLRALFPYGVCRYYPTCSQYMIDAMQHLGWRGLLAGARRVLHCHPFSTGGHDPVRVTNYELRITKHP